MINPGLDFRTVIKKLTEEAEEQETPVVELINSRGGDGFKILVSTILSARTRDETTKEATKRLFKKISKVSDLTDLSKSEVSELIYPVGFYNQKAGYLKQLPEYLEEGEVPSTREELMKLPGVGRKTANIVLNTVFGKDVIAVDTHVHRITNRWGLVETETPLQTEKELMKEVPREYWRELNYLLVSFGQNTCKPVNPKCEECPVYDYCERIRV